MWSILEIYFFMDYDAEEIAYVVTGKSEFHQYTLRQNLIKVELF